MVLKLIKMDCKFAYRKFVVMALILLTIGFLIPFFTDNFLKLEPLAILIFTLITVITISVWITASHFHKNLFENEGYLMFTLPVKTYELLLSKVITSIIWFNFMAFYTLFMVFLLLRDAVSINTILNLLNIKTISIILILLLEINFRIIALVLSIYLGILLSRVRVNNNLLGAETGIIVSILCVIGSILFVMKISGYVKTLSMATFFINIGVLFIFIVMLFIITAYLMKYKVNV